MQAAESIASWSPTADDLWDRVKSAHLLQRTGFGPTRDEVERVYNLGPQKAVDWLLDFPNAPVAEQSPSDVPEFPKLRDLPRSNIERRNYLAGRDADSRRDLAQEIMAAHREAGRELMVWWLNRMLETPHPLQEKLAFFWHGHFTSSLREVRNAWQMWYQNETLRTHAAGNFRDFAQAMATDPAMIAYLNNQQNRKGSPNENFARELMELFTLGIGNYTEQDIKEAARAFTGYHHDGDRFTFRRFLHDNGTKRVLGVSGDLKGEDVVDICVKQRACAPFIASKLFRYFVYEELDTPTEALLGKQFRDGNMEIRPLLQTLFTSRAFYSPQAMFTQIKSPVQLVLGTVRMLEMNLPRANRQFAGALDQMGQTPLLPPNVKGWAGGRSWINTSTLFVRYNTCIELSKRAKVDSRGSPAAVVDAAISRLLNRPITAAKRQTLLEAVGKSPDDKSAHKMIELIVSMPEYQLC